MGCVGNGTTVEYIESFNSDDDGFEFFGGTVNTKYLISAFNTDDSFDYDQGFRGHHQFWFAIQREELGDKLGEYDSGDAGALTAEPLSNPQIYNATYIGSGAVNANPKSNAGLNFKEYGGGAMYNSIFTDFGGKFAVIDSGAGETSYSRLKNGALNLENNLIYRDEASDLNDLSGNKSWLSDYLSSHTTVVADPQLNGISRSNDGGLNPTIATGSQAWTMPRKDYPRDSFFTTVNYVGAFGEENWAMGWTALDFNGVFNGAVSALKQTELSQNSPREFALSQNCPNPFNPTTTIDFAVATSGMIKISIFTILGQKVATLINGAQKAGTYSVQFDASNLSNGWYFYRLQTDSKIISRKMMLLK